MAKKEIIVIYNLYASALSGMLFLICEKRPPVLLVAFLISFTSLGQNYYSGRVLGFDKEPIANAHIQVINTSIGTITNSNGYFSFNLANDLGTVTVSVSHMGYLPCKVTFSGQQELIFLEEDTQQLAEVVITPKDYAKELVEKSIERIPANYPTVPELHKGFFREQTYWEGEKHPYPIYIAEAVLETLKSSYSNRKTKGQGRLVESRKYESGQLDSLGVRVYAGSHIAHDLDFVARREGFLKDPDGYYYEVVDTTRLNQKDVFKISFNRKDNPQGHVYIMDSSFAIVKAECRYTRFPPWSLPDRGRRFGHSTISYYRGEDQRWRVKHIDSHTAFDRKGKILSLRGKYATTNIEKKAEEIPYPERIQYRDILLYETGQYDSNFWKHYNIIIPNRKVDSLFQSAGEQVIEKLGREEKMVKTRKTMALLSKFQLSYEIAYYDLALQDHTIDYANPAIEISRRGEARSRSSIGLSTGIHFMLTRSYKIGVKSIYSFSEHKVRGYDLELSKVYNINPRGQPILLSPAVQVGHQALGYFLGNFRSENTFTINSKEFDSGDTDVFLWVRGLRVQPTISLGIEKSKRLQLFFTAGYNFMLRDNKGLFFEEQGQFFLRRRSAFLDNLDEGLRITSGRELLKNEIVLSFGASLKF